MRIVFSNDFGCHSKSSLILNFPQLVDVSPDEYHLALAQGWLATINQGKKYWYQSRSTRTLLSATDYKFNNDFVIFQHSYPQEELDKVYNAYCLHKHYKKYFEVGEFLNTDIVLGYYANSQLTAWTKLRPYDNINIESVMFAWDYQDPSSHLGIKSLRSEIAWAKQQGYEYFYMGPGYEKNSIYKSDIDGFEWWTGSEWSQDKTEYIRLCKRDSVIASNHQVHLAFANLQPSRSNP